MINKTKVRIFYMIDRNGNRLEASQYSGHFEKYGISNTDVLRCCMGWDINEDVTFEMFDYEL